MRIFDYSFLDNGMLPAGLVNLTANIYAPRYSFISDNVINKNLSGSILNN